MFQSYRLIAIAALIAAVGAGCSSTSQESHDHADDHANEEHHDEHGHREENGVHLTKTQLAQADIQLGQVEAMNLDKTVQTTGQVILPSQHRASVNAVKGGQVTSISVRPGERVQQGQVLAQLRDPSFIDVQQQYLAAKTRLTFLRAQYNRKKTLYEGEVGAEQELQQVRADYYAQKSRVANYAAQLRMLNLNPDELTDSEKIRETVPLRAPIKGIVQKVKVRIGQYLEPRSTLFTILERQHLRIKMMIYEKDLPAVEVGQPVHARRVDPDQRPLKGEVVGINHGMSDQQRAVTAFAKLDTIPASFKPGMYMQCQVVTGQQEGKALPNSGTVRNKQEEYIFYTTEAERDTLHFNRMSVKAGPSQGEFTAISMSQSLPDNASVVTQNAHYLLREMMEGAGGGHSH
jgi:cobalt-zinc-cadmium efflux system membrane fusion protein